MGQVPEVSADATSDHTLATEQLICLYLPSSIVASTTGVYTDHQPLPAPSKLDGGPGLVLGNHVL